MWSLPIRRSALACALALASGLAAAFPATADIIRKEDMLRGISMTHAQCSAITDTVWVTVSGRDFCVRYYLSTAGGEGLRPVVFIQGDYFGKLDPRTWSFPDPSDAKDINTDDLMKMADAFSKLAKTTAIYLARIGVEGTSGNHTARKTVLELNLMNAALDAVKRRYGFEGFHLVGQSGGAKIVGALSGLRRDIACAVAGSGPLMSPGGPRIADPARTFFDVTQSIPQLARNPMLRLMLVTDPSDKRVPIAQQTGFVDKMR
jgi:pimeloyl-ACP methyl ester carboxylesterase